ncbi:hypothetical protein CRD60_03980 [Bifidobacterium aemilianum]|uniref:ABC transporter domain-containing protein n=1 Tax=Bifidobacterium aemilianum TaxID=2493120 RepID=A0A366K7P7_9BIFI|nr:ABC transporter ATP-binding protein [Bifidobacterium aemilianum]RBP97770.1 hypothetical protein CRD60_03980 [Bifidobacterium aemilianum]
MLDLDAISFSYQGQPSPSLDRVSLHAGRGQLLVLSGRSGCGKTTVSRVVNGLIPELFEGSLTGSCTLADETTAGMPIYRLSEEVGSVFQNPKTQFFTTDVRSELAFPMENVGKSRAEIQERIGAVASLFGVEQLLDRSMFSLSGGQKQMVAIASSVMLDPKILLLDEPSSNLDSKSIDSLAALLGRLKASGLTILVIEHRLYYLRDLADRFIIIDQGQVIRDLTAGQMAAMGRQEREELGLRALNADQVGKVSGAPSAGQSAIAGFSHPSTRSTGGRPQSEQPSTEPSPAGPGTRLHISKLTFRYKSSPDLALDIPDLTLTNQEVTGIIGRNGAGKSTLAKVLTGLVKPDRQSGFILDDQTQDRKELTRNSFLVFQDVNYQLFCESVEKELALGAQVSEGPLTAPVLLHVAEQLNLQDLLARNPNSLSGGEKQRVAVGCAVTSGKRLIVLDEPTSGLDLYHMNQVTQAIAYLHSLGDIVLIISHDREFLQQTCQRFLTLDRGRIVNDSSSQDR